MTKKGDDAFVFKGFDNWKKGDREVLQACFF